MTGHTSSIYSLAFSAESTLLVSGGADWTVRTWDVKAAGGQKAKAQQQKNGVVVNGNGSGAGRGPVEEESLETYVRFRFLFPVSCDSSSSTSYRRHLSLFLLIGYRHWLAGWLAS